MLQLYRPWVLLKFLGCWKVRINGSATVATSVGGGAVGAEAQEAAATQLSCAAGAIGAGVGEVIASLMPDPSIGTEYSAEEKLRNRNAGKIIVGVISAYSGYDVVEAANAADNAIENNNNTRASPKRFLFSYMAKEGRRLFNTL